MLLGLQPYRMCAAVVKMEMTGSYMLAHGITS
jgi:hypothetical protein